MYISNSSLSLAFSLLILNKLVTPSVTLGKNLDGDDATSETDKNLLCHPIPSLDGGLETGINWKRIKERNNNKMWLKHSYGKDSMLKYYYKYYNNKEFSVVKTLEHILRLQWYFKTEMRATPTIVEAGGTSKSSVHSTNAVAYTIVRDSDNAPTLGSGTTADAEL